MPGHYARPEEYRFVEHEMIYQRNANVLGFGWSALTRVGALVVQNHTDFRAYARSIDQEVLPVDAGRAFYPVTCFELDEEAFAACFGRKLTCEFCEIRNTCQRDSRRSAVG